MLKNKRKKKKEKKKKKKDRYFNAIILLEFPGNFVVFATMSYYKAHLINSVHDIGFGDLVSLEVRFCL